MIKLACFNHLIKLAFAMAKKNKSDAINLVESGAVNQTRERLKNAAVLLFAQHGIEGVSTRDIAREAGVNIGLIKYYFGSKEGLYRSTVFEFVEKAVNEMMQILDLFPTEQLDSDSYSRLMRTFISGVIEHKMKSPQMSELMMRETLEGLPHLREIYEVTFEKITIRLLSIIEVAKSKEIIRGDIHPHTLLFSMIHSMDSYFFAQKCGKLFTSRAFSLPKEKDLLVDEFCKIFVEGVLK